jgi:hypothetical protein
MVARGGFQEGHIYLQHKPAKGHSKKRWFLDSIRPLLYITHVKSGKKKPFLCVSCLVFNLFRTSRQKSPCVSINSKISRPTWELGRWCVCQWKICKQLKPWKKLYYQTHSNDLASRVEPGNLSNMSWSSFEKKYRWGNCCKKCSPLQESCQSQTDELETTVHLAISLKEDRDFRQSLHQKETSFDFAGGKESA